MTEMIIPARARRDEVPIIVGRLRLVAWLLATVGLGLGVIAALATGHPTFLLLGVAAELGVSQLTGY
jgi:hypothetical protein